MRINNFKDLDIWKNSIDYVKEVYLITSKNFEREFSLKDQIRRSAVSIPSNIAEGFERNTRLEFKRFLLIAKESCGELRTQLYISKELNLIDSNKFEALSKKLIRLSGQIGSLIRYLRNKKP